MTETRVAVGRLKARLSEYLRRARAGEAVVITDRGKPIARLSPLEGDPAMEGRVTELRRAGLIRGAERRLDASFLTADRPCDPSGRSLESVLDERAEGW